MALPKVDTVSTQALYEPDAQAILFLAEKTSPEDQRVLLAALDALQEAGTDGSVQVPANWEETIQRIRRIPPEQRDERTRCISAIRDALNPPREAAPSGLSESLFGTLSAHDLIPMLPSQAQALLAQTSREMREAVNACRARKIAPLRNEPGLEELLSYFCPHSLDSNQFGFFETLTRDLRKKIVPENLKILKRLRHISRDERKFLRQHSPKTFASKPALLKQVLQTAYDNILVSIVAGGLVSIVAGGAEEPRTDLPDLQTGPTLVEKARITREWLRENGPSIKKISLPDGHYATCLPEELCALENLSFLIIRNHNVRTLPHSIKNLIHLQELFLDNNFLATLPQEIGKLSCLTLLILNNNQISILPQGIGNLKNLWELYLDNNRLTALPQEIGALSNLKQLSLKNNKLTALPQEIGALSNLVRLDLENNQIVALPKEIGTLKNLQELNLRNNRIVALPKEIGTLSNLQQLNLENNLLSALLSALPQEIGTLSKLTRLFLGNNCLAALPQGIGTLSNLIWLFLEKNRLIALSQEIGGLKNLQELSLGNNRLTALPQEIGALSNLQQLSLENNPLTEPSLQLLECLKKTIPRLVVRLKFSPVS